MKVDLHLHSTYSWDSNVSIRDYITRAEALKFGASSITDHNNTDIHTLISELQDTTDVVLIPGQEVSTKDGHLLVYGNIPKLEQKWSMIRTINEAKLSDTPVLCIAAHPFDLFRGGKGLDVINAGVDGFEILNASTWFNFFNRRARRAAVKHPELIYVGNSDSHKLSEFGTAYTDIEDAQSMIEVFENLKNGVVGGSIIGIKKKLIRFGGRKFRQEK